MIQNKKVMSMLGLARRAGKVDSGEFATDKAVKTGKAYLVLVAEDASENTKKMFRNMCEYYEVPFFVFGSKDELGSAIGQGMRASLALTAEGFAQKIEEMLTEYRNGGCENGERTE